MYLSDDMYQRMRKEGWSPSDLIQGAIRRRTRGPKLAQARGEALARAREHVRELEKELQFLQKSPW